MTYSVASLLRRLLGAAVLAALVPGQLRAAEPPNVVASVMPVAALVAGVMDGIGKPSVIVKGNGSPHTYALRPSEARALSQARLVFWIGPIYESFLARPLAGLATRTQVVELATAPGITILPARAGGAWEMDHDHAPSRAAAARAGSDPNRDGHLYLDPDNAKIIVRTAAIFLGAVDQENGPRYRRNADRMQERIDALDGELALLLGPAKERPFIVFHDAYQYVEQRYDLKAVGSVTVSPARLTGARRLSDLKRKIADLKAACVFSEPQFEPALVRTLIAGTAARTAVLDPLGADLPIEADSYFTLMQRLGQSLAGCLVQ